MKLSVCAFSLFFASAVTPAAAFVAPSNGNYNTKSLLRMNDASSETTASETIDDGSQEKSSNTFAVTPKQQYMSFSVPFMDRPPMLDGTLVGDVGFDPLGFARSKEDLMDSREAEVKHARLAMLAAAGWPISELFDKKIASWTGMAPLVDGTDRVPSLLNGGLGKVSPVYWAACILGAAAIDMYGIAKAKSNDSSYFPGNLGFDPLRAFPKDDNVEGQERMKLAELKNGRLAMIAVTAFAVQEFVQQEGVVDKTPLFFKPLTQVLHEYANSGYITP